jgi:hypothetical protein
MGGALPYNGPTVDVDNPMADPNLMAHVKQACVLAVQPQTRSELNNNVSECIFQSLPEVAKAAFAARQYILTLWPAFLVVIVGMFPDPSVIVYDNVWWATLLSLSCAGMTGLDTRMLPHQLEANSVEDARMFCMNWRSDPLNPSKVARSAGYVTTYHRANNDSLQWAGFAGGFALWITFVVYFIWTLLDTMCVANACSLPGFGVLWFMLSPAPALLQALLALCENSVELFEPLPRTASRGHKGSADLGVKSKPMVASAIAPLAALSLPASTKTLSNNSAEPLCRPVPRSSIGLQIWLRIFMNQLRLREYRLLVRPSSQHPAFLTARLVVFIGRLTIFVYGSVSQGTLILMPWPNDYILLVLLVFMAALPRVFWSMIWKDSHRGADLVIFVK